MPDPIHQFDIHPLIPIKLFGWDVSFTNSSAFMLLAVILTVGFFMVAMRGRSLVPGRLQSVAEVSHEFVASMLRESTGQGGHEVSSRWSSRSSSSSSSATCSA